MSESRSLIGVAGAWDGGAVIGGRLYYQLIRSAWTLPAVAGSAVTAYLAYGAWVSAHNPRWLYISQAWWWVWLRPGSSQTVLTLVGLWIVALFLYWRPRRSLPQAVGLAAIVTMVVIGGVLGATSLIPCRGGQSYAAVAAWVLGLFVGNSPSVYPSKVCPGQPPLALQAGQAICLAAILTGALAAAVLWRQPLDRLRASFVRGEIVFTGLDSMTIPLLRRLAEIGRPGSVVVIEPDSAHPLLVEARAAGAHVLIGDPASERVLEPVLVSARGLTMSHLYALRADVDYNEAVLAAARRALRYYRPDPERQPHLIARIDDPWQSDFWRARHCDASSWAIEDALSAAETTARALVNQVFGTGAQRLLLCGDSTLALAILLELARRSWERQGMIEAAALGRAVSPDAHVPDEAEQHELAPFPVQRVVLVDQRAEDLRREYLAISPHSAGGQRLQVTAWPLPWKDRLLAMLESHGGLGDEGAETAVVIANVPDDDGMREAGRVARLLPGVAVFVLTADGSGATGLNLDQLHRFQRSFLVNDMLPEDTWTRIARYWHECYRLAHPPRPGDPRTVTARPWTELDEFSRQDNILQVRSLMAAAVARGRRWVPRRSVTPGSFIELSERDLDEIARDEHTRWYQRRRAAGWTAGDEHDGDSGSTPADSNARVNARVVPWDALPAGARASDIDFLRSQFAQLEELGFMPIVPEGGPPGAGEFERIGVTRAERRTGAVVAWQASEKLVLRTLDGRAVAQPGDWIVEGRDGQRWPVPDELFRGSYKPRDTSRRDTLFGLLPDRAGRKQPVGDDGQAARLE
jgi:Trk K+ transport system NAD-binding subunit